MTNPLEGQISRFSRITGLSERMVLWSLISLICMTLFTVLFTFPQNKKIKQLDEENTMVEARLKELVLLRGLNAKLNVIQRREYPSIKRINAELFEEDRLLELPDRFEELAAVSDVTMVSIDTRSVNDGEEVAIHVVFQGEMPKLYNLLKAVGQVKYAKRLESMTILALPDAEQMELQFRVPIK